MFKKAHSWTIKFLIHTKAAWVLLVMANSLTKELTH